MTIHTNPSLVRAAWALVAAFIATAPLSAETVVVPRDYPTIQRAIEAIEGTPNAVVRIDSNRTFDETLLIRESVVIEAGERFHPTIRGKRTPCAFPIPRNCTVEVRPIPGVLAKVLLRGLRIVPANSARAGDRLIQSWADAISGVEIYLSNVTLDNRGKGVHGIVLREEGGEDADGNLIVQDSLLRLNGSSPITGISVEGFAEVHFDRSRLVMSGPVNIGIRVANATTDLHTTVQIDQSTFDVTAKKVGAPSVHVALEQAFLEASDNAFFSRTSGRAQIFGVLDFGGNAKLGSHWIDRNGFDHKGSGEALALAFLPRPQRGSFGLVANNVITNQAWGIAVLPQGSDGEDESFVRLRIVNNTLDRFANDGVFVRSEAQSDTGILFSSNLVTRSRGYAVRFDTRGGKLSFEGANDGYFGNAIGDVQAPYDTKANVLDDPLYVSNSDLRLREDSPMIDAGHEDSLPLEFIFDRAGQARRQGRIDIGAFESERE